MITKEVIQVWDEEKQKYMPMEVVLVQCFGLKSIPGKVSERYRYKFADTSESDGMDSHVMKEIEVFDETKTKMEKYLLIDYLAPCPAEGCGKMMHVQATTGSVHMACCSNECYAKYWRSLKGNITIHSGV